MLGMEDLVTNANSSSQCFDEYQQYSSDSRSNITRGTEANKQISLADQGLTRSFHWCRERFPKHHFLVF